MNYLNSIVSSVIVFVCLIFAGCATRPKIIITSPATSVVSQPMIQIVGYYPSEIKTITFDISNSQGVNKSQSNGIQQGYVTSQFFDKAKWDLITKSHKMWKPGTKFEKPASAFTTNYFQIYDINLTKGKNRITIHITDDTGKQWSVEKIYTLDLASDKTPPVIKLIWPQNGTKISGDEFELKAQVDDNNATVKTTIKNSKGENDMQNALVERDGLVTARISPVEPGTNSVIIVATDPAGNSSTNIFNVSKSPITVTMQPLAANQLNKSHVNVKGTVSDPNCIVKVNDIQAAVHKDGTWEAQNVPVSPVGTAYFDVELYEKDDPK